MSGLRRFCFTLHIINKLKYEKQKAWTTNSTSEPFVFCRLRKNLVLNDKKLRD